MVLRFGLMFGVSRFSDLGSGFGGGVSGFELAVSVFRRSVFRVRGFAVRVFAFRVSCSGFRVIGFRVSGSEFRGS